jgi:transcription antitermination factor NusG
MKVAELLYRKKIDHYCPINKVVTLSGDRKKIVYEPLFKSLVFVRVSEPELKQVIKVEGILNMYYWLDKPAIIADREIEAIKCFMNDHSSVSLEKVAVRVNDTVNSRWEPFMECEGNVLTVKNKSIKVCLPSLGFLMIAEMEKEYLEKTNIISMVNKEPLLTNSVSFK